MSVKHSANKEGTWLALFIKVYYPGNLAICKLLFAGAKMSLGATDGCHLQSGAPSPSTHPGPGRVAVTVIVSDCWPDHSHLHPQTGMAGSLGTSLFGFGLMGLELVPELCGHPQQLGLPAQRGPARTPSPSLTAFFSFFLCRTWDLIYGP